MRSVFLCHSPADRPLAHELAEFLLRGASLQVFEAEGLLERPDDLPAKVREGLMADTVLVILSPHSAPARWRREEWMPALWEEPQEAGVEVAFLLAGDCRIPDLLRRRNFFDLTRDRLAGFRQVKAWLLRTGAAAAPGGFAPDEHAPCQGREEELETLRRHLGDRPGAAVLRGCSGCGKTALALAFAARAAGDFEGVFWATCAERSVAGAAGDVAAQMGLRLEGPPDENLDRLRRFAAERRFLIVLDDVTSAAHLELVPGGWSSTLITTRREELAGAGGYEIFFDQRIAEPDLAGLGDAERLLLEAIAACAPACSLESAAAVAEMDEVVAGRAAESLLARGALLKLEDQPLRFSLPAWLRESVGTPAWRQRHAERICRNADAPLAEIERAFAWVRERREPEAWALACALARLGCQRAKAAGRNAEAYELARAIYDAALERDDLRATCEFAWELYWIALAWGWEQEARKYQMEARTQEHGQLALPF